MQFGEILRSLVRDPRWSAGDLVEARALLTEAAAGALGVARVSVWRVVQEGAGISCEELFVVETGSHAPGPFLASEDCPAYFEAIEDARVVAVEDAPNDPRTSALGPSYLSPLCIGALLDAPIVVDGELWGVVCHEHIGGVRVWTARERTFAASIGDLMALAVQTARRHEAELTLRRREQQVRVALEGAEMADWAWDLREDQIRWSEGVASIFGLEPGVAPLDVQGFAALVHPDDRGHVLAAVASALTEGGDYYVRHRVVTSGGAVRWIEGRGRVERDPQGRAVGLIGIVADVSARHELEERLARSARLESLGRLAGGVAHDFNNLLTAIGGAAELLELKTSDPSVHRLLRTIGNSVGRAAALTSQLLAFGRRQPTHPRATDLAAITREAGQLLGHLLGENVSLDIDAPDAVWVCADPVQLEQVVVNLAVNARDAMPDGGSLRLRVVQEGAADEGTARLVAADTGSGIPAEVLEHVFEPFYSTKPMGVGAGLGLAICHGIVSDLDGTIEVESRPGQGSTFTVSLPTTSARPLASAPPASEVSAAPSSSHILLVEDDPDVASLLVQTLKRDGHTVSVASTGPAGVELVERTPRADLLICDVVLPGLSGPEVVRAARARNARLPVLLITGYAPDGIPEDLLEIPMLTKPFTPRDLRGVIASLVGQARLAARASDAQPTQA